jgi:hypothetical protein
MRAAVGMVVALLLWSSAVARAEPVAPVESWSRAAGSDTAVNVNFTSDTDACYGVHATAHETSETVTVELQSECCGRQSAGPAS